jgi:hypothetical protein
MTHTACYKNDLYTENYSGSCGCLPTAAITENNYQVNFQHLGAKRSIKLNAQEAAIVKTGKNNSTVAGNVQVLIVAVFHQPAPHIISKIVIAAAISICSFTVNLFSFRPPQS